MKTVSALHSMLVFRRRAHTLARALADTIPASARSVLEVGCEEGAIAALIQRRRPGLVFRGLEPVPPALACIPIEPFDGVRLPFLDQSFDVVMFVDRLHHAADPAALLGEARRVARLGVVLKDHVRSSHTARMTLRFMDWVGNAWRGGRGQGAHPPSYLSVAEWRGAFRTTGLAPRLWNDRLGLYPAPASWLFERDLHFVAWLGRVGPEHSPWNIPPWHDGPCLDEIRAAGHRARQRRTLS